MGLDMYLTAERFLWTEERQALKIEGIKDMPQDAEIQEIVIKAGYWRKAVIKAGYWRKANHIHMWFVANVQDGEDECKPHYVSKEKLKELGDVCQEVLNRYNKETKEWKPEGLAYAQEKLGTQSGFFFGSTEYDEWYIKDLEETIAIVEKCLKLPDSFSFEYCSSW